MSSAEPSDPSVRRGMSALLSATDVELLTELDAIESAIGRAATFNRRRTTEAAASTEWTVRVSDELLGLAEQEHRISAELRHRHRHRIDPVRRTPDQIDTTIWVPTPPSAADLA